ncbi:membrane protein [Mycobacteroides abscessus subsp. abscessus]|nr:membrane protein [Mycobacteroides abscessus subsp. abscessus]SLJ77353.1 membrane protein [Mycobacteroides abscessus subsp. abscessus]
MMRAIWNDTVIAEAEATVRVEGNYYFPPQSLRREYFTDSRTKTLCPWKGVASYYHLTVGDQTNPDAAWYYPKPSPLARRIRDHVAFWNGVEIVGNPEKRRAASEHPDTPRMAGRLPVWRIGIVSGLAGISCCVGPTVLALLGVVSGATALAWANNLYNNYAWWFRLTGLGALAGLLWWSLRRRDQCSIDGVRNLKWRLLTVAVIAIGTYLLGYTVTTWLGRFA